MLQSRYFLIISDESRDGILPVGYKTYTAFGRDCFLPAISFNLFYFAHFNAQFILCNTRELDLTLIRLKEMIK